MNRIAVSFAALALVVVVALFAYVAITPRLSPAVAQASGPAQVSPQQAASDPNAGIVVSGQSQIAVQPNIAIATIGVEITAASLTDATTQANTKASAVLAKIKGLGVADKDIQTTDYSVNPITQQPKTPDGSGTPAIVGYRVSNQFRVIVRKIDDTGKILDAAVGAGANTIYGISYSVDDFTPYRAQARAAAVKDAQDRAAQLAKAANVQLGPVLSIVEGGASQPIPRAAFSVADAAGVPIQTGELQISVDVQVRFGIK